MSDNPVSWLVLLLIVYGSIGKLVWGLIKAEKEEKEKDKIKYDQDLIFFD